MPKDANGSNANASAGAAAAAAPPSSFSSPAFGAGGFVSIAAAGLSAAAGAAAPDSKAAVHSLSRPTGNGFISEIAAQNSAVMVEELFMRLIRNPLQQISKPAVKNSADQKSKTDEATPDEEANLNKYDFCWLGLALGTTLDQGIRDKIIKILLDKLFADVEPVLYELNGIKQSVFVGLKISLRFCFPNERMTIFNRIINNINTNLKITDKTLGLLAILFRIGNLSERQAILDKVRDVFTQANTKSIEIKASDDEKNDYNKLKINILGFLANIYQFINDEIANKFFQILAFAQNDKNQKVSFEAHTILSKIRKKIGIILDKELKLFNFPFLLPVIEKHPVQLDNVAAIQAAIVLVITDGYNTDPSHGQKRRLALEALEGVWQTQWRDELVTSLAAYIKGPGEVFDTDIYVILARGYSSVSTEKRRDIEEVLLSALTAKTDPSNRFEIMEALAIILIAMRNPNVTITGTYDEKDVRANTVADAKDRGPNIPASNRQIWLLVRIHAIVWGDVVKPSVYNARYLAEILALHTQHMMEQVAKETARVLSDFLPREVIESVVSHYTTNMLRYG